MSTWIEVSEPHLAANYRALTAAAGPATSVLAVVKANAYGHGAALCAPILARAGATWLGVSNAAEGAKVRQAIGASAAQILIMCGFLPHDVPLIHQHRLTPVVWTPEQLSWLQAGPFHLEIDTGMARQGVLPGEPLRHLLSLISRYGLQLDGLLTHFTGAEESASAQTQTQQRRFEQAVAQVQAAGHHPAWIHAGNTSTVDNPAQTYLWLEQLAASVSARAMVRTGLGLYGYALPLTGSAPHIQPALQPVLTWKTRILALHDLAPGQTVGYNATFTAPTPMRVALLAAGYADGLRRELSSANTPHEHPGGWAMIRDQKAPILGRISMNLTVVDATAIPGLHPGDEAILLGPGITADDHARLANTIAYEILCGIRPHP